MRLQRVRFEGEIRFPGLARNTTTFSADEGYDIETDMHWWVTVRRVADGVWVPMPWPRVLEAVPAEGETVPDYFPELLRIGREILAAHNRWLRSCGVPTAVAPEPPQPAPRARRGRHQAPPE